jgi:hypothetical protein
MVTKAAREWMTVGLNARRAAALERKNKLQGRLGLASVRRLRCSALDAALETLPVLSETRAPVPSACFLTIPFQSQPHLSFLMFQSQLHQH